MADAEQQNKEKEEYEARLQRRLQILVKELEAGKIKIAKGLQVIESLKVVRYKADGTFDLDTVDGLVRSMALAIEGLHVRTEAKESITLAEIQNTYFTFLKNNFGHFYDTMQERKLTPYDIAVAVSSDQSAIEELTKDLPNFLKSIKDFWVAVSYPAHIHIEDMSNTLKGVFGGDLFPSYNENIASKCGLYADTIILPDPFMRSMDLFGLWKPKQQAYYLIKHAMNLLQYKELACADLNPPIVVILPDTAELQEEEKEFYLSLGKRDALIHAEKIFGRKFSSSDELIDFANDLSTPEQVIEKIVDGSRILFDTEWEGNYKDQIIRAVSDEDIGIIGTKHAGFIVASQAVGRMSVSNELLVRSRRLNGTPIIDAPTSWQYLAWKLEYDAGNVEKENDLQDLHVLRGLQSMQWLLGRIPPEALIELRKADAIGEIRNILGKGIDELALADPTNFRSTSNRVFGNLDSAFAEHRAKIEELSQKKWKFAGTEIGSWLVVGSLYVTAAATGQPVWGIAAYAADQVLDPLKLKHIPKSIKEFAQESQKIKKSPVGLLFQYEAK